MRLRPLLLLCLLGGPALPGRAGPPVRIEADLREAPRGLLHAHLQIPVTPGSLTLYYPQWIPGEHGPTGPVADLAGLQFSAGGHRLDWRRDLKNMYAFHLEIPAGVETLDARLDYLAPADTSAEYSAGPTTTAQLAVLNWSLVTLYPPGPADRITYEPSVLLPPGWKCGTSLSLREDRDGRLRFQPVTLEMLIDQPLVAGAHFSRIDLTPGGTPEHYIDCVAESDAALDLNADRLRAYRQVPLEYAALMGARYYQTYHFLLTLSDRMGYSGVEHHQCSDDRAPERSLIDDDAFLTFASLLTHEYFHSWNGKHRRPEDLLSPDYQQPMRTDLLWVYEGLTEYYGDLMAARAGLWTSDDFKDHLAELTARLTTQKGREWRPLQDTADAAQVLYLSGRAWSARRRGVDFYDEGVLIWLGADMLIREGTGGAKNLDDFARAFFGDGQTHRINPRRVPGVAPTVSPYRVEDVYAALNRVLPYDWPRFFAERLDRVETNPPLDGLVRAGWRMVLNHSPNRFVVAYEKADKRVDLRYSLGFTMDAETQEIGDVVPDTPADRAGLGPKMKVIGVNGRKYSDDVMRDAVVASEHGHPIELLIENADYLSFHRLDYSGGLRYPHLERLDRSSDRLAEIVRPLVR